MKKIFLAMALTALLAVPAVAAIEGSAHDFTTNGNITETRICVFCHTPHFALEENDTTNPDLYYPLWNRMDSIADYTLYASATTDFTVTNTPTGPSKLCLSCHDGSIAVDSYGNVMTGTVTVSDSQWGNAKANLDDDADSSNGIDMGNDHPISFSYVDIMATDGELRGLDEMTAWGQTVRPLLHDEEYVECSSCHDVHNKNNYAKLLVMDDLEKSQLCRTCHTK